MKEDLDLKIKIATLKDDKKLIPFKQTLFSACYDLTSAEDVELKSGEVRAIGTGVTFLEFPAGYHAAVISRSGLAVKSMISVLNSPGIVDSDYRGEIKVILINHSKESFFIKKYDRIAQMAIQKQENVLFCLGDEEIIPVLDQVRGEKGFGSSGIK